MAKKPKLQLGKNKKEQAIITIGIAVVLAAIYFILFIKPLFSEMGKILPKVSMLGSNLKIAKPLIARRPKIEKEKARLLAKIATYKKTLPSEEEIPKLLEELSNIAGESGVKLIGIKPFTKEAVEVREAGKVYREIPIRVEATSGYHELGQFLAKLEGSTRFIMVKDLAVSANPHNVRRHNIKIVASTYTFIDE